MSDQLAFDFTLPTVQEPAVRFPPHPVPETDASMDTLFLLFSHLQNMLFRW